MLEDLGIPTSRRTRDDLLSCEHPQLAWARSGAMALTGCADGAPLLAPAPLASAAEAALLALRGLAGSEWGGCDLDAAALLGERAANFDYSRRGSIAPGRSCRLLPASDEWLAVNLARESDRALLPAWLESESASGDWEDIQGVIANRRADEVLARARLLGMPVAPVARVVQNIAQRSAWFEVRAKGNVDSEREAKRPIVLDLSSLWAGPLCGHLLRLAGARVIKFESLERPDGARTGPSAFFDLMNAGKESVALDFTTTAGRRSFEALLERVDIVIESARPRALRQLGIVAEEWIERRRGLTWLSITGYGRTEPEANWVAFGDDAGAAAGLCWATAIMNQGESRDSVTPLFCGDAIADPLTGMHAAVAALASWQSGKSQLFDISLCGVVRHLLEAAPMSELQAAVERDDAGQYCVCASGKTQVVVPARTRTVSVHARALGADTSATLASLGVSG